MTPSAEPANPPAEASVAVPSKLLEAGEVVLLAIKPSSWYVLVSSWPVFAVAILVAAGMYAGRGVFDVAVSGRTVSLFCLATACLRVIIASFQWLGRLYVLTNLRVLQVRGVMRVEVFACRLKDLRGVFLSQSLLERLVGIGSLFFQASRSDASEADWVNIARHTEVQRIVNEAIRRAR